MCTHVRIKTAPVCIISLHKIKRISEYKHTEFFQDRGSTGFYARSQNCEKRLLAPSCLSVRPSVRMEQLGSYWMDFHEIWHLCTFRKSVKNKQVSLKFD